MNRFRECLDVFDDTVAIVDSGKLSPVLVSLRRTTALQVKVPPIGERTRLWRTYLGTQTAITLDDLRTISALYNLGIDGIVSAGAAAREAADFEGQPIAPRHVSRAVRHLFDADLSTIATRADVTQTWDDLVLPEDLYESVHGIIDRIRFRGEVMGKWGFARKLGKGLGLTVLFSGEPGTGKSMVAGLIAAELGLDLYVVDLSQITSKWLGETEKNLARAFDAAEAGHVLLLFDEADSVLGKRTSEMRGSNDRYANLEVNFILARIEQFQGIAFFTTNLASAIDPAVSRRMSVHLQFPFPEPSARVDLWRRMIPAETPIDDDIDFYHLAERYELSGGFIRNIVLRAAFLAARDDLPIAMSHLELAAEAEYRERGSLLIGGRLA
jgi:SpoVK/Ycf46/Vps4 family AAA+-type ATPase